MSGSSALGAGGSLKTRSQETRYTDINTFACGRFKTRSPSLLFFGERCQEYTFKVAAPKSRESQGDRMSPAGQATHLQIILYLHGRAGHPPANKFIASREGRPPTCK